MNSRQKEVKLRDSNQGRGFVVFKPHHGATNALIFLNTIEPISILLKHKAVYIYICLYVPS